MHRRLTARIPRVSNPHQILRFSFCNGPNDSRWTDRTRLPLQSRRGGNPWDGLRTIWPSSPNENESNANKRATWLIRLSFLCVIVLLLQFMLPCTTAFLLQRSLISHIFGSSCMRTLRCPEYWKLFPQSGLCRAPFVLAVASVSPLLDRTDGEDVTGRPCLTELEQRDHLFL